jgi:hypothetical protein
MNPPITFDVNIPSNHNTTKTTAIVCNMGWANYFCLGPVSKAYRAVERHARRRLRQWLCAKHKLPWPSAKQYPNAALHDVLGLIYLTKKTQSFPWAKP